MISIEDLMDAVTADIGKPIRRDMCDWEASRIPILHGKYRKILYYEKVELEKMKAGLLPLLRSKREYYKNGATTKDDDQQNLLLKGKVGLGSDPTAKKHGPMKEMVDFYVESDEDVIKVKELIVTQNEKVEYLKDVLEDIRKRSFSVSSIIKFLQFKHGLEQLGQVIDMTDPDEQD